MEKNYKTNIVLFLIGCVMVGNAIYILRNFNSNDSYDNNKGIRILIQGLFIIVGTLVLLFL